MKRRCVERGGGGGGAVEERVEVGGRGRAENLERSDYYPICCSDLPTVLFY